MASTSGTLPSMRKIGKSFLFACLLVPPILQAHPQSVSSFSDAPAETITLGNSAATLPGPWKFAPGDSPWQNGAPVWAQPGFDDANWAAMDLAPKAGSIDPAYGTPGFAPGWTARGYPNLYGYAWYRLRVGITDPGQPLELKMPNDFDDGYQVYANGRYIGQFGRFSPRPCHHLCRAVVLLPAARASAGRRNPARHPLLHDQRYTTSRLRLPAACTSLPSSGSPLTIRLLQAGRR